MSWRANQICTAILLVLVSTTSTQCEDCGEAKLRTDHAVQRVERALARSNIAALRTRKELELAGVLDPKSRLASLVVDEPARLSLTDTLEAQHIRVLKLREHVRDTATIAMDAVKQFYPERYVNKISIPRYYDKDETKSGPPDCKELASETESWAFAAEQWSQLADIAAEQAIELSARMRSGNKGKKW